MKYIIDFYKELDTINLLLFWGTIIIILLLLIFSIIIVNKNKKLKKIIISKEQEIEQSKNELAIKNEQINIIENIQKEEIPKNIINDEDYPTKKEINIKAPAEEKEFIAEEHVIEYNQNNNFINQEEDIIPDLPIIEEDIDEKETTKEINIGSPKVEKKEIIMPTALYQKNVLREMALNQTSPIGIIKKNNQYNQELSKAKELHDSLHNLEEYSKKENYENNYQKEMNNSKEMINKLYENKDNKDNNDNNPKPLEKKIIEKDNNSYLNEVSKKLSEAKEIDGIERTEYEIKQEEDAIISYEELMQKKDSIQMIDEEDAVISIGELYEKNKQKEKLYNITKEEENDKFISELKHFRGDL